MNETELLTARYSDLNMYKEDKEVLEKIKEELSKQWSIPRVPMATVIHYLITYYKENNKSKSN